MASIGDFKEIFGRCIMLKKIQAIARPTKTKKGNLRFAVMIDNEWWASFDEQHGDIIRSLNKGDYVDVELKDTGQWKNIISILPANDVNEDVKPEPPKGSMPDEPPKNDEAPWPTEEPEKKQPEKKQRYDRDTTRSIVRQSIIKGIGGINIPPAIHMMLIEETDGEKLATYFQRLGAGLLVVAQQLEKWGLGE